MMAHVILTLVWLILGDCEFKAGLAYISTQLRVLK